MQQQESASRAKTTELTWLQRRERGASLAFTSEPTVHKVLDVVSVVCSLRAVRDLIEECIDMRRSRFDGAAAAMRHLEESFAKIENGAALGIVDDGQ